MIALWKIESESYSLYDLPELKTIILDRQHINQNEKTRAGQHPLRLLPGSASDRLMCPFSHGLLHSDGACLEAGSFYPHRDFSPAL